MDKLNKGRGGVRGGTREKERIKAFCITSVNPSLDSLFQLPSKDRYNNERFIERIIVRTKDLHHGIWVKLCM